MPDRTVDNTKQLPTKEIWADALGLDAYFVTYGAWAGILVDTDTDAALLKFAIPHDFKELVSLDLWLIPYVVLASMSFYVAANWAFPGTSDQTNLENNWHAVENTVFHQLTKVDIRNCVDAFPLQPGQLLGMSFTRNVGNNIDALILGAKLRYR